MVYRLPFTLLSWNPANVEVKLYKDPGKELITGLKALQW